MTGCVGVAQKIHEAAAAHCVDGGSRGVDILSGRVCFPLAAAYVSDMTESRAEPAFARRRYGAIYMCLYIYIHMLATALPRRSSSPF